MTEEIEDSKEEEWEEEEESSTEVFVEAEDDNVMQFSDYVEADEKRMQKQRITELRRRAEERQDWRRISDEYDWDFDLDDALEEA